MEDLFGRVYINVRVKHGDAWQAFKRNGLHKSRLSFKDFAEWIDEHVDGSSALFDYVEDQNLIGAEVDVEDFCDWLILEWVPTQN